MGPASYQLLDIIGAPNMTGEIWDSKSGIPDPFDAAYYNVTPEERVHMDYGSYTVFTGQRGTAKMTPWGGEATAAQLKNLGRRDVKLINSTQYLDLPVSAYLNLLAYDSLTRQAMGYQEVQRQVKELKAQNTNLRIAALASALVTNQVNFDVIGNLLAPGVAVPTNGTSVTFGIPNGSATAANSQPNIALPDTNTYGTNISTSTAVGLDPKATGTPILGVPAGDWSSPSSNIIGQLRKLQQAAEQITGIPIRHAYYGVNVPNFLVNNGTVEPYLARNPVKNGEFIETNELPNILGITWHKAWNSYFVDQNGTIQPIFGANTIVFSPEPTSEVVGFMEGSWPVPTENALGQAFPDGEAVRGGVTERFGLAAYGVVKNNPVTVQIFSGDVFLPAIKNPLAFFACPVSTAS